MEINKFVQQSLAIFPQYEKEKVEQVQQDPEMQKKLEIENRINTNTEQLNTIINSVNNFIIPSESDIKFTLHEELNEYYVAIIDHQTREVIREIPPKKFLDMYAEMIKPLGLLLDKKI